MAAVIAAFGALVSLATWHLMEDVLERDLDRTLAAHAHALAGMVDREEHGGFESEFEALHGFHEGPDAELPLFEIRGDGGRVLVRAPRLQGTSMPDQRGDWRLPDGRAGRILSLWLPVGEDDHHEAGHAHRRALVEVRIAVSREELDATMRTHAGGLALIFAVVALVALLFTHRVHRRGLDPLEDLAHRARMLDARSLSSRLPVRGAPEARALATALNGLLERLEAAFERERRMTANLAHELRTPLSELRVASDLAVRWPDDGELATDLVGIAARVSTRMGAMIETLLRLARIESGEERAKDHALSLREAVRSEWSYLEPEASERGLRLELTGEVPMALGDGELLASSFGNLLRNAVQHAPEGSLIRAELIAPPDRVGLRLSNSAPALEEADLEHLTEAFWCKDEARSQQGRRGLGLTLTQRLLTVMGGRLGFALEEGELRVQALLPRA